MALLLEGGVMDERDSELERLRDENAALQEELNDALTQAAIAKREAARSVVELRRQLSPLYRALQAVFGEIDAIAGSEPTGGQTTGDNAKWDAVKAKMPPRHREAIELLLLQGAMRRTQVASALKMDYSNCTKNVTSILLRQGWLVDNGGMLSLKKL